MVMVEALVVVMRGRWGSWYGVVAQVAPVAEVGAQVAPVAEVVARVAPVAVIVAQSCWCRRRSRSRRVRLGPGCDTAWSSTSCCCIVEP